MKHIRNMNNFGDGLLWTTSSSAIKHISIANCKSVKLRKKMSITFDNETVLNTLTVTGFISPLCNSTHKTIVYNPPALGTYIWWDKPILHLSSHVMLILWGLIYVRLFDPDPIQMGEPQDGIYAEYISVMLEGCCVWECALYFWLFTLIANGF